MCDRPSPVGDGAFDVPPAIDISPIIDETMAHGKRDAPICRGGVTPPADYCLNNRLFANRRGRRLRRPDVLIHKDTVVIFVD